jgi:hypothetical protein
MDSRGRVDMSLLPCQRDWAGLGSGSVQGLPFDLEAGGAMCTTELQETGGDVICLTDKAGHGGSISSIKPL